jgi:hypothetical protein
LLLLCHFSHYLPLFWSQFCKAGSSPSAAKEPQVFPESSAIAFTTYIDAEKKPDVGERNAFKKSYLQTTKGFRLPTESFNSFRSGLIVELLNEYKLCMPWRCGLQMGICSIRWHVGREIESGQALYVKGGSNQIEENKYELQ